MLQSTTAIHYLLHIVCTLQLTFAVNVRRTRSNQQPQNDLNATFDYYASERRPRNYFRSFELIAALHYWRTLNMLFRYRCTNCSACAGWSHARYRQRCVPARGHWVSIRPFTGRRGSVCALNRITHTEHWYVCIVQTALMRADGILIKIGLIHIGVLIRRHTILRRSPVVFDKCL